MVYKCHKTGTTQYLHTSGSRIGGIGEFLVVQLALVTWGPVRQEALVAGPVSDCVWRGTRQAEQHCVIGYANVIQTKPHPLPVEVASSGVLARVQAGKRPESKPKKKDYLQYALCTNLKSPHFNLDFLSKKQTVKLKKIMLFGRIKQWEVKTISELKVSATEGSFSLVSFNVKGLFTKVMLP